MRAVVSPSVRHCARLLLPTRRRACLLPPTRRRDCLLPLEGVDEVDGDVLVAAVGRDVQSIEAVPVGQADVGAEPHQQLDQLNVPAQATLKDTSSDPSIY